MTSNITNAESLFTDDTSLVGNEMSGEISPDITSSHKRKRFSNTAAPQKEQVIQDTNHQNGATKTTTFCDGKQKQKQCGGIAHFRKKNIHKCRNGKSNKSIDSTLQQFETFEEKKQGKRKKKQKGGKIRRQSYDMVDQIGSFD